MQYIKIGKLSATQLAQNFWKCWPPCLTDEEKLLEFRVSDGLKPLNLALFQ